VLAKNKQKNNFFFTYLDLLIPSGGNISQPRLVDPKVTQNVTGKTFVY
jgi:hypothetical protein